MEFDFSLFEGLNRECWAIDQLTNPVKRARMLATATNTSCFSTYKGLWDAFKYERLIHPIEFPETEWDLYDRV
jgi:hypothetical protein